MPVCVHFAPAGSRTGGTPSAVNYPLNSDGTAYADGTPFSSNGVPSSLISLAQFLLPDPSAGPGACQFVAITGLEYKAIESAAGVNSFSMTAAEGGVFSAGVISCWVTAFVIKSIIRMIRNSENE